jgi:hypothetical protein
MMTECARSGLVNRNAPRGMFARERLNHCSFDLLSGFSCFEAEGLIFRFTDFSEASFAFDVTVHHCA